MRLNIFLICLFLPLFSVAQNFEIESGYCKIKFPAEPIKKSVDTIVEGTDTTYYEMWQKEYDYESTENANLIYLMQSTTFPSHYIYSDSSYQSISDLIDNSISNYIDKGDDFELLSTSLDMIDGYPGKVFKIKVKKSNTHFTTKCYLIKNQVVMLGVLSKPDTWFNTDNDLFFDSFSLNNVPQNKVDYGFTFIRKETYTISFPDKPETENSFVESEYGTINLINKMLEKKDSEHNLVFMSAETKYPESIMESDLEEFYKNSMTGFLNSTNAQLIKKNKIKYKKYDGYEYYSSMYEGAVTGFCRMFLIDDRFYMLAVLSMNKEKDKEVDDFFESFKLLKK